MFYWNTQQHNGEVSKGKITSFYFKKIVRAFVIERRLVFTHEAFKQKLVRLFKKKGGEFAEKENVRSGKAAIVAFFFFFKWINMVVVLPHLLRLFRLRSAMFVPRFWLSGLLS